VLTNIVKGYILAAVQPTAYVTTVYALLGLCLMCIPLTLHAVRMLDARLEVRSKDVGEL
jgi:hypothetical protein